MKKTLFGLAMAATVSLATPAWADNYKIDTDGAHAFINFRMSHLGYSFIQGRFDTFSGSFKFDKSKPAESSITVDIDPASVNTNHQKRDDHIRGEDFLFVSEHKTAKFESTKIEVTGDNTGKVHGNLTLRGVTKPITIDVTYIGGGDDPWGGHRQGFVGTTSFVLADFGVPHGIGKGTIQMTLDVEGIRQ